MLENWAVDAVERLRGEVRNLPEATVRLLLTPEAAVLAEALRSWPALSVFGHRVDALAGLASDQYAGGDPFAFPATGAGPRLPGRGAYIALLLLTRDEVDLARDDDEPIVTSGPYRRPLTPLAALARLRVAGARVEQGELPVRFEETDT